MEILFEDSYLIAVNKPAGLNSDLDKQHHPCVESWVYNYLKKTPSVYLYNRLDRPSSGIVLLAKNKSTLIKLQTSQYQIIKIYRALIENPINPQSGNLINYVFKDLLNKKLEVYDNPVKEKLKFAKLKYKTIISSNEFTELEVTLVTGRYHQIRAQLAHKGFPIIGDHYYGSTKPMGSKPRIALHAYKIMMNHPDNGNQMMIKAPLPEYWLNDE